jgi:hypothetical protein
VDDHISAPLVAPGIAEQRRTTSTATTATTITLVPFLAIERHTRFYLGDPSLM